MAMESTRTLAATCLRETSSSCSEPYSEKSGYTQNQEVTDLQLYSNCTEVIESNVSEPVEIQPGVFQDLMFYTAGVMVISAVFEGKNLPGAHTRARARVFEHLT